jgi:hypothetical protein
LAPVSSVSVGGSISPSRIFGPERSCKTATGFPDASDAARTRATVSRCSASVPWAKLMRATFMPASISPRRVSGERLAGPIVQTMCTARVRIFFSIRHGTRFALSPGGGAGPKCLG